MAPTALSMSMAMHMASLNLRSLVGSFSQLNAKYLYTPVPCFITDRSATCLLYTSGCLEKIWELSSSYEALLVIETDGPLIAGVPDGYDFHFLVENNSLDSLVNECEILCLGDRRRKDHYEMCIRDSSASSLLDAPISINI